MSRMVKNVNRAAVTVISVSRACFASLMPRSEG